MSCFFTLILIFFVNPFVHFLLDFNFIPQSKFMIYYFFNLVLIRLIFFVILLKKIYFKFHPSIEDL